MWIRYSNNGNLKLKLFLGLIFMGTINLLTQFKQPIYKITMD